MSRAPSIVLPVIIADILIIGAALLIHDGAQPEWRHAARWTADLSAILFLSVFAPEAVRLLPRIDRRSRVLGFFAAHMIHAGAFVAYHLSSGAPALTTIIAGGFGYAIMGGMVLFSPSAAPRLHRFGIWYLWLVFLVTFASGLGKEGREIGAMLGIVAFAAAAIARFSMERRNRARSSKTPT